MPNSPQASRSAAAASQSKLMRWSTLQSWRAGAAAACFALAPGAADAALTVYTSELAWLAAVPGSTLIDFDALVDGSVLSNQYTGIGFAPFNGGAAPVAATENSPFSLPNVLSVDNPSLGQGGGVTFSFAGPAIGVAFWYSDAQFAGNGVTVYGLANQALGEFEMLYPHPTEWQFVGFRSASGDISRIDVAMSSTDRVTLDNLQFSTAVPEPAAAALLLLGAAALAITRRHSAWRQ